MTDNGADLAGIGPAEWDLVSVAVLQRRFGLPREELLRFCGAYGFDLSGWEDFEVLLSVHLDRRRRAAGDGDRPHGPDESAARPI